MCCTGVLSKCSSPGSSSNSGSSFSCRPSGPGHRASLGPDSTSSASSIVCLDTVPGCSSSPCSGPGYNYCSSPGPDLSSCPSPGSSSNSSCGPSCSPSYRYSSGFGSSSTSRSGSEGVPQGNRLDSVDLYLPLENLLDLTLIWTLLHLLSTNQVQELWGQDEVTLHCLCNRNTAFSQEAY